MESVMFEMSTGAGWIILAYIVGTAFGMWIKFQMVIEYLVEGLIEGGFLKTRENADGEIEILKHNED
jgi:hypothetical protein